MKNTIIEKTELFKSEVNYDTLNDEQKRIYNAFVYRRPKPYKFDVVDRYGNTIRFALYTNKRDDGVLHILNKHYKGEIGSVTSAEIIKFCDVIRKGVLTPGSNSLTYTWNKGNSVLKLIVGLKRTGTDVNILKSFYSNRKPPKQPVAVTK